MTADAAGPLRVSSEDGVLRVTVNRPEVRNALSLEALRRIGEVFAEARHDDTLRVAVLRGAGEKAFASGGDLVELMAVRTSADARAMSEHGKRGLDQIRRFPVPVIGAVNGVALGGGAELALACDVRFAAPHAGIGLIHSRLAIAPSWGGGVDLMRLTGSAKGLNHLVRGEVLEPDRALELGVYDSVARAGEDFDQALETFIAPFRRHPPQVARAMKSLALGERLQGRADLDAAETEHFAAVWSHSDHWAAVEGLAKGAKPNAQ